ncbi:MULTISPECIES: LysR family transcriptional regulator [unclassified Roseivirga]|jgi:DNA-binding transcriptional LysR family regulator|uniref:LysR family transcriptional regulator n=1 Tax=unclassified Roseivirga TaxID=2626142 RepID=UPI00257EC515|nr:MULTISPECIES: LysR family transcriptional regulator [unclassified Roseivirga]|tara:strand:- start:6223 stop:7095 length:873 start_codon:yes stop_codon:yes gene_type:complete
MELRHLRYFLTLGKELHFAKAAEKLYITQPALTKQIQQLEEELKVKLFERTKRRVKLTAAGEYLLTEAEYMLNHLEQVVEATQRKAEGEEGEVRIGFVGSAMQNIIPNLLEKLHQKHPGIHTSLQELNNRDQLDALRHDKLDIAFVRLVTVPKELETQVVFEDSFSLVVSKTHPVSRSNFSSLTQFRKENFILFSNDYSQEYYDNIMSIFTDHGFEPKVSHRSVQANSIFRLVEKRLGVAIVPSALQSGVNLDIEFISLAHLRQRTQLMAVWHKQNRNEALGKFLELLSD